MAKTIEDLMTRDPVTLAPISLGDLAQAQDARSCLGRISAAPPNQ